MFIGNLPPKSTATNLINFLVKVLRDKYASNEVSQRLDRELRDEDLKREIMCIRGRHEVFRPNEENADGKTLFNDFVFVDLATEVARDTLVATLPGLRWFGKKLKADNGVLKKNKFDDKVDDKADKDKDKTDLKNLKTTTRDYEKDDKDKSNSFVRDKVSKSEQVHATNDKKTVMDIDDFRNDLNDDNDNHDTINSRDTDKTQKDNNNQYPDNNDDKNVLKQANVGKIDNLANIDDFLFSGDDEDAYDTEKDRATQARSKVTSVVRPATNMSEKSRSFTSNRDKRQGSATSKKVTLFVGNLSFDTDSDDLAQLARDTLSQTTVAATVSDCRVVSDKFSGRKRGFGYIDLCLDDTVDVNRVVVPLFQDTQLQGRHLKIDVANEHHSR